MECRAPHVVTPENTTKCVLQASHRTEKINNNEKCDHKKKTCYFLLLACDAPLEVDFEEDWHLVLTVWHPLASHNCHIAFYDGQLATEEGSAGSILLVEEPCYAEHRHPASLLPSSGQRMPGMAKADPPRPRSLLLLPKRVSAVCSSDLLEQAFVFFPKILWALIQPKQVFGIALFECLPYNI